VPQSILYDNSRIAVIKVLGGGKGNVEGLVKLSRAKFMTPIPRAASYDELNAKFEQDACVVSKTVRATVSTAK
jgi:transposase